MLLRRADSSCLRPFSARRKTLPTLVERLIAALGIFQDKQRPITPASTPPAAKPATASTSSSLRVYVTYGILGSSDTTPPPGTHRSMPPCRGRCTAWSTHCPAPQPIVAWLSYPVDATPSNPALAERPSAAVHLSSVHAWASNTPVRCRRSGCCQPCRWPARRTHTGAFIVP
jgi:hypothetical protein